MQKTIIILASALLLAYAITEITVRFFPGDFFALLVVATLALAINGWFVARQYAGVVPAADTSNRNQGKQKQDRRNNQSDRNANRRSDQKKDKPRNDRRNNDKRGNQNREQNKGDRNRDDKKRDDKPTPKSTDTPTAPTPAPAPEDIEKGTVKWFNRSKGYGFIVRENEEEIFVHQRSIVSDNPKARPVLRDGQNVTFTVTTGDRGPQAEYVQPQD